MKKNLVFITTDHQRADTVSYTHLSDIIATDVTIPLPLSSSLLPSLEIDLPLTASVTPPFISKNE